MNTDAFFTTGKQHNVCQDYALASRDVVVLSDGCSSSPHTDVGARLLCRMVLQHGSAEGLVRAQALLEPLGLPPESLDATLLMARWDPSTRSVQVSVHGDGLVVARRRDGTHLVIDTSYPSGAPLYPSYDVDLARRDRYALEFGTTRRTTTYDNGTQVETEAEVLGEGGGSTTVTTYEFYADMFDLVILLSDGAHTFRRPLGMSGATEAVPLSTVIGEVLAIKGFVGEFVTRRAKKFLKNAIAKGWHHDDDFSVAAIYLGEISS